MPRIAARVIVAAVGLVSLIVFATARAQTSQPAGGQQPVQQPVQRPVEQPAQQSLQQSAQQLGQPAMPPKTSTTPPGALPTTRPSNPSAEAMLRQMLQPQGQAAQPLQPIPDLPPATDATGGANAVDPNASTQPLKREGSLLIDQVGRLTPGADGKSFELTLEADGVALSDPPLVLLPNRKLMQLEDQVLNSYSDLRVRVSGEISEYRGRNYLLLQKWSVIPDAVKPLQ